MASIRPKNLILRCYGYSSKNAYIGVCIDLNIAIQGDSQQEVRRKMNDAIKSYILSVLDTDDQSSIPDLILRKAPLQDWIIYYWIKIKVAIRQIPKNSIFKEYLPFHLAHNC